MSLFGRTRESGLGMVPTLLINRTQIFRVLEAIRNTVLEWSLKLEQSGILGEGMTFTREEVQKAAMVTYNIQSFTGILGNVSSSQIQVGDYNSIHAELKRLGIPQEERNELEQIVDELPKADKEKKTTLLKRGAEWVTRNATALGALSETIRKWFEVGS
jgi:AbiTii